MVGVEMSGEHQVLTGLNVKEAPTLTQTMEAAIREERESSQLQPIGLSSLAWADSHRRNRQ